MRKIYFAFYVGVFILNTTEIQAEAASRGPCVLGGPIGFDRIVHEEAADPEALLARFTSGGSGLVEEIRNIAARVPESAGALADLASFGSPAQRVAIGSGLGGAAALCARHQPDTALRIERAAIQAGHPDLTEAFERAKGDIARAAPAASIAAGHIDTADATPGGGRSRPQSITTLGAADTTARPVFLGSAATISGANKRSPLTTRAFGSVSPFR